MAEQSILTLFSEEDEDSRERKSYHGSENLSPDIPRDIWSSILNLLFLGDRHVFKAVCKSWKSIDDKVRLPLPPPVHSPDFDWPCLMFSRRSSGYIVTWEVFHSLYNDFYRINFPELLGTNIRYSKCGWLLVSDDEHTSFFFNPSTKVKIELPKTEYSFLQVCFTSSPTSIDDCIVFGILSNSTLSCTVFGFIKLGEHEWTVYGSTNTHEFVSTNSSPVFYNGLFYCLDQSGDLGVFNVDNQECPWVQYSNCHSETLTYEVLRQSYMAEVDGDIWVVFVTHDDRRVSVYKLNLEKFVWDPLQSLDNKCLFVSPGVSFAETCAVKSLANKIYFNKFQRKNGVFENGVVYSLASERYYSVGGGLACKKDHQPLGPKCGIWFKPVRDEFDV